MGIQIADLSNERAQSQAAIGRRATGNVVPLSHGQEQIWLHSQLVTEVSLYNEPITIYKAGTLDAAVLERALTEMVRRHEAWRTNFRVMDGQPVQVIGSPYEVHVPVVDLRNIPGPQREPEALRLAVEDAQRPFDLTEGPLFRVLLIRVSDTDHRLYLTLHHIIFDGFSMYRVFLPELSALYEAFSHGKRSPLPELPVQFADFSLWQREWLVQSGSLSTQLAYWKKQLTDLSMLQLPADRPRPAMQSFTGAIHPFALSQEVSQALKMLGRRSGTTLFMTLLAGLAVLLHRYSALDDVAIATVSSARKHSELESLLGYFLNPVVLRNDLSGDPTFSETLHRVRNVSLDALSNDDAPFTQVVNELHPARTLSCNPLFQVLFTLEPPMPVDSNGWSVALTQSQVDTKLVKFDLCLELDDAPSGIAGRFKYSTDLFEPPTIARMAGHLETLLRAVAANPNQSISRIPLLTDEERHQVAVEWNSTDVMYATDVCIHHLFENKVEMMPHAVALAQGKRLVSYQELNSRANQLAETLRNRGVGPEEIVAICLKPSPEMIISILGVLKAGGACLPLDPSYPAERSRYVLEDAKARLLLTTSELKVSLATDEIETLCIDEEAQSPAGADVAGARNAVGPNNLAYVIYTSGSTGNPKGVLITHRNLVHSTQARLSYYTAPNSRFLLLSSFAYDSSLAGIFGTLCQGGTLVLCPNSVQESLTEISQLIARHKITELLCVPSVYSFLLEQATHAQLASLRGAIVAGESCTPELIDRHYKLLPHTVLYNEYGPTEASVWSTVYKCTPKQTRLLVPIGRPIPNVRVYVVDRHLNLTPIGVAGEVCIAGPGLVRGYLDRPEFTAEKFLRNPFSDDPSERLYRTGDVARYLPDGNLELLGRLDEQVKIRGFRIELEEIASVIAEHDDVRQAVAALQPDSNGRPELAAYVVLSPGRTLDTAKLRLFLKQRLPEVMIPSSFVTLDRLPVTPNGKIDRRALPKPLAPSPVIEEVARTPVEESLVEIFEKVLSKHPVGTTQNFFDLGGHSLLVARLLLQVEQKFGKKLSLADVFQAPTVKELALLLANGPALRSNGAIVPIHAEGSKPPLFWVRGGALYFALSRRLGPDQPLLGLHLPVADAARLPLPYTLESIAAALVARMREAQPTGPYSIAGLCVNGVLAYEMARQLRNQGQEVGLLALFDAQNPAYYRDFSSESRGSLMLKKFRYHLSNLHHTRISNLPGFVRDRMAGVGRRLSVMRWRTHYAFGLPVDDSHLKDLDTIIHPASYSYQPRPYPGPVVFFQSTDWPRGKYWEFHAGWKDLVQGMEIYRIRGGHESMFHEENVELLATSLQDCLQRADHGHFHGNGSR